MVCINRVQTPESAALLAGLITMIMFYMSTFSARLPFAFIISASVSYFVYTIMGGKIFCDESQ